MATTDERPPADPAKLRWKPSRIRPNPALRARRIIMDRSRLKLDIVALAVFFGCVFLGLSLLSYDPADPPNSFRWPQNAEVRNLCGPIGASAAFYLLGSLGTGAFVLLAGLVCVDVLVFARRMVSDSLLRALGWVLLLVGTSALSDRLLPTGFRGSVISSGGYLGAYLTDLSHQFFNAAGTYLLLIASIVFGVFLTCDYVLLHAMRFPFRVIRSLAGKPIRAVTRRKIAAAPIDVPEIALAATTPPESLPDDTVPLLKIEPDAAIDDSAVPLTADDDSTVAIVANEPSSSDAVDASEDSANDDQLATIPIRTPNDATPADDADEEEDADAAIAAQLNAASDSDDADMEYELPAIELLDEPEPVRYEEQAASIRDKGRILEETCKEFGHDVKVVQIDTGPVITQYEIELAAGLRVGKIHSLADDLAIALKAAAVRIVAPLPNRDTVGVEVPNDYRAKVSIKEVIAGSKNRCAKMKIPLFLGKDVKGQPLVYDLAEMPHLLIAGRTGTGKSVCLNSIILSILMTRRPDEVKMLMIDPKMVELSQYRRVPHLMHPVVTDMKKAEAMLAWAVDKMEERYDILARAGVRHMSTYNQLGAEEIYARLKPADDEEKARIPTSMPFIVIVADEMADLMMTAPREVESHIIRLAQKSRAVGIHLIVATQKPTVDVITGLIKSNLPSRIAFQVSSRSDSRVVLDEMGAEKLLGLGDMLFLVPGTSHLVRAQGTYASDREINGVVQYLESYEPQYSRELVQLQASSRNDKPDGTGSLADRDELYEQAIDIVVREGRGSTSLLQRAMGIGYGRAARLIDTMAEDGIVGDYNGSQAREVLFSMDEWEQMKQGQKVAG